MHSSIYPPPFTDDLRPFLEELPDSVPLQQPLMPIVTSRPCFPPFNVKVITGNVMESRPSGFLKGNVHDVRIGDSISYKIEVSCETEVAFDGSKIPSNDGIVCVVH